MKKILFILVLASISISAQNRYLTKTGTINFEASVPSFEEVAAKNNSVTAILNTDNGEIAALVLVKGFRFKNALMEEHFNENYAESDKFPKASFKGKIENFNLEKIKSSYTIDGQLTFHGKTIAVDKIAISFSIEKDLIKISGTFSANASDFDVDIPKIVKNKIAQDVVVSFEFELQKK
ncbi:MAG: YceI family protein [Psychroserpens sp.]|uniref:YceI family protein n=1 Tax=Psychroserpens sp. TaxID=2020870 RepID=UPI003001129D